MNEELNYEGKRDWLNTIVLTSTPLLAAIFVPYHWIANDGFTGFEWAVFTFFMFATGTGITGGYHRLWSHKAYTASAPVRLFYAYWGACATQNTILKWAADHRRHHKYVDINGRDPYSANRGFWYSHIGWILKNYQGEADLSNVKDLKKDRIIMFQARHYLTLVIFSNIIVPIIIGALYHHYTGLSNMWGVLILAGVFRFVLNHHFTFFINSACHIFGRQPYSDKDTSRDNWFLALFTYGEGYHNYHHTFQTDYRNGIRWYHYDPTKWVTKALSWVGLTSKLKQMPDSQIEKQMVIQKLNQSKKKLYKKLSITEETTIYQKVEKAFGEFTHTMNEWLEEHNKFTRFCRVSRSEEEKALFMERIEQLQARIEAQKAQLYKFFNSSSLDDLQTA